MGLCRLSLLNAVSSLTKLVQSGLMAVKRKQPTAGDSKIESALKTEQSDLDLDPVGLVSLSSNLYRESIKAMNNTQFKRPSGYEDQHMDIGCGAGNFTAEELLPRLRPCKRVVGIDVCSGMIDYARKYHQQPQLSFEVLDISDGNPNNIVEKYGLFDRVYAFLSFHFTSDLEKTYRNIYRLLKDGGECLAVSFNRTGITDTWHDVYNMEAWMGLLPNPYDMLPRFRFNQPVLRHEVEAEERRAIAAAGLDLIACSAYSSQWTFPTAHAWMENYVKFFKLDARVPDKKQGEFQDAFMSALLKRVTMTPEGASLIYDVIVAHSQKPEVASRPFQAH